MNRIRRAIATIRLAFEAIYLNRPLCFEDKVRAEQASKICSMENDLANAREFLRNENRQINAQLNRVMMHNKEILKAFRAKVGRRARWRREILESKNILQEKLISAQELNMALAKQLSEIQADGH